jgi:uncharacterized membrane protein
MTTLVFLLALAGIAGTIFWMEGHAETRALRPGLLTWAVSGNWPAKIGAVLVTLGTGALLRYLAIHIEVAPPSKLMAGVAIAGTLGLAAMFTGRGDGRRTLSLVLSGSAFGVAYLTAYSAFVLFGMLDNMTGVGLLMLVAVASGVFAVTRSAVSLAVVAMVGAYLSPAFSVTDPGPLVVYGYYIAATVLTLFMVSVRGWRPLIHLSFLFTLAGGVFFAWTARYYHPDHFEQMAPMLCALVGLHILLPIVERRQGRGRWIERLDVAYTLLLPFVATVLAFAIAPTRVELSVLLIVLGFAWIAAAAYLRLAAREGTTAHAVIGIAMMLLGVAARFTGLPWDVITLALATAALAFATYRPQSERLRNVLTVFVLILAAVHALVSSSQSMTGLVFANGEFIQRLIAAGLIIYAGALCHRVKQPLDVVFFFGGIGWVVVAVVAEFLRWDIVPFAVTLHWLLLAFALTVFGLGSRVTLGKPLGLLCALGILATAVAAHGTPFLPSLVTLPISPVALLALAIRGGDDVEEAGSGRLIAAIGAPIVAALWASQVDGRPLDMSYVPLTAASFAAVMTLIAGRMARQRSAGWIAMVTPLFVVCLSSVLLVLTTARISRDGSAIAAELICLAGLGVFAWDRSAPAGNAERKSAFAICAALLLQAHLLRWFGPAGDLSLLDLESMRWPAAISLLWAGFGATLTIWARRAAARPMWIAGATLLIAAAVKVVLIDFGSLGELQNILAVIAAGGMFLLVGWLAPMPPPAQSEAQRQAALE